MFVCRVAFWTQIRDCRQSLSICDSLRLLSTSLGCLMQDKLKYLALRCWEWDGEVFGNIQGLP